MSRSDRVWAKLGRTEPYSAIIAHETREGFFDSGERHVVELLRLVDRLKPGFRPRRAVDFGCGVGRIVIPLARRFDDVVGVDVSEAMLAEARRNCDEHGCTNVDFVTDLDALANGGSFDLVHSYIVLQHIQEKRGMSLIADLVDLLEPGGIGAIHVQYARDASTPRAWGHWLRLHVPFGHNIGNLIQGMPARAPLVEMHTYDIAAVLRLLQEKGCGDALLRFTTTDTGGFLGVVIVFARQPSRESPPDGGDRAEFASGP